MSEKLWETCREAKDTMQPHKTNQDIADESGVSVNAVSQFLRGETTKPYIDTVGPICASLGVSLDEHFGVPPADPAEPSDAENSSPRTRPFVRSLPSSRSPCTCTDL